MPLLDTDLQRLTSDYRALKKQIADKWDEIISLCVTFRDLQEIDIDDVTSDFKIGKYTFLKQEDHIENNTLVTHYFLDDAEKTLACVNYINNSYRSGFISYEENDVKALKEALTALKATIKNNIKLVSAKKKRELNTLHNLIT